MGYYHMAGATVDHAISSIQAREENGDTSSRAVLAKLRSYSGLRKPLETSQELWPMVLEWMATAISRHSLEDNENQWKLPSKHNENGQAIPTITEKAIAATMIVYSRQSGSKNRRPHDYHVRFGEALSMSTDKDDTGMANARKSLFSATASEELFHQLEQLATRLNVGYNYADLADDLVIFQTGIKGRSSVIGKWSREFYSHEVKKFKK